MRPLLLPIVAAGLLCASLGAQPDAVPAARLVRAPHLALPGRVDSGSPMVWDRVEGAARLFALTSWGGIPSLLTGASVETLQAVGDVGFTPQHPGHGIWIESVIADEDGTWFGYYHHEVPADVCARPDRSIPSVRAVRSTDRGRTWATLGTVLEAPPGSEACRSTNRYVMGGVGDVSVMLDADRRDLFLYFSQYSRDPAAQGVALARLAWADREAPEGKVTVWNNGAWLPARFVPAPDAGGTWTYPPGTPLQPVSRPWHDGVGTADAYWGPSIHWNTYLARYVMLLNRTRDESFNNDGIYISYARTLDDPRAWSAPQQIFEGGGWYPQVAGLDAGRGTDKEAGRRARFFITGRSDYYLEFP